MDPDNRRSWAENNHLRKTELNWPEGLVSGQQKKLNNMCAFWNESFFKCMKWVDMKEDGLKSNSSWEPENPHRRLTG